jgi:6-phosphogluconolactonase
MFSECPNQTEYLAALTQAVTDELSRSIAKQGQAVLAVSGGRSPVPLFHALREADIDWSRVTITLVDERYVPTDHPDSNEQLVREHLLSGRAAAARFVGLVHDPLDLAASVEQPNREAHPVTVAVLGMGEDGHTASLFPGAEELAAGLDRNSNASYLSVTPPAAPHQRISLTLAALLKAQRLILAIAGDNKRKIYEQASEAASDTLPISHFIHQTKVPFDVYWTR